MGVPSGGGHGHGLPGWTLLRALRLRVYLLPVVFLPQTTDFHESLCSLLPVHHQAAQTGDLQTFLHHLPLTFILKCVIKKKNLFVVPTAA